jgi:hypothetical protein
MTSQSSSRTSARFVAAITSLALIVSAAGISRRVYAADPPKNVGFEAIRGLVGTWVSETPAQAGSKPTSLEFKSVSNDTAVMEIMFPGSDHEMVNMYTIDGDSVLVTHYCSMGNQPHMRLASVNDGVLKFEFVNGGNMKSRDEAHMDSLEITIKGDHLTEKWSMYMDGKVTGNENFEVKRKA